ncbi:hypothetical protein GCM10007863_44970 [Dyella mobilis]|nr:hypothetical protein GCM10007863_44970 [Dyella mobilis]
MQFVPNQLVDLILMAEALHNVIAMLPDARRQVGGDAYIQGTVAVAGKDIDARLALMHTTDFSFATPELATINNSIRPSFPRKRESSAFP